MAQRRRKNRDDGAPGFFIAIALSVLVMLAWWLAPALDPVEDVVADDVVAEEPADPAPDEPVDPAPEPEPEPAPAPEPEAAPEPESAAEADPASSPAAALDAAETAVADAVEDATPAPAPAKPTPATPTPATPTDDGAADPDQADEPAPANDDPAPVDDGAPADDDPIDETAAAGAPATAVAIASERQAPPFRGLRPLPARQLINRMGDGADVMTVNDAAPLVRRTIEAPLNANEYAALVSVAADLGEDAFVASDLTQLLNAGERTQAERAFVGLGEPADEARRRAELALFRGEGGFAVR